MLHLLTLSAAGKRLELLWKPIKEGAGGVLLAGRRPRLWLGTAYGQTENFEATESAG